MSELHSILLVDDDATFRTRLAKALGDRNLLVLTAESVAAAEKLLTIDSVDGIVLDLNMPGESGLELIPTAKELQPSVKIVVLTGYGSIATALEAVRRGAFNYLTKPADADQIVAAFLRESLAPIAEEDAKPSVPSLPQVEWEHLQRVLTDCGGNISKAAKLLGMHRRSLQRKLAKLPSR